MGGRPAWKRNEACVAKDFGTERTPLSGGNSRITRSDTLHKRLFIDSKRRKSHAVLKTFREIIPMARKEKKIPVLVLVEPKYQGYYVVVRSKDLEAFAKEVEKSWRRA
jgi:hypothetical protein